MLYEVNRNLMVETTTFHLIIKPQIQKSLPEPGDYDD